uniref:Uncharacterized protein n=1 Tax=Leptobrachium leishanense TaxID=445787 RepID=A0A8C5LVQ3_9ANUR
MVKPKTKGVPATPRKRLGETQLGTLDAFLGVSDLTPLPRADSNMATSPPRSQTGPPDHGGIGHLESLIASLPTRADIDWLIMSVKDTFKAEVDGLRSDMTKMDGRLEHVERRLEEAAGPREAAALSDMRRHIDDLENRSRRHNLRIRGVRETVTDLRAYLVAFFSEVLGHTRLTPEHIDRAHRVFRPRLPAPTDPLRDIVCHITDFTLKESVAAAARNITPLVYDGEDIEVYNDLSTFTLGARRALRPLLAVLREAGIPYRWGHPFALMVQRGQDLFVICTPADVQGFLRDLDLPSVDISDWERPTRFPDHRGRERPQYGQPRPQRPRSRRRGDRGRQGVSPAQAEDGT